jgi:3-dehydroquinate synthase
VPADAVDESGESSGEKHKTLDTFSKTADAVLANGIDKHTCIVSLGGGCVNNLCGFLASALYRGIWLVHMPTTMMAQADAAIDFKQAVNHPLGKNLLGAYYPASSIICDVMVLKSLSSRHLLNGISECVKHAMCQDETFLNYMVNNVNQLRSTDYLEHVIKTTTAHKAPTLTAYDSSDFNEMCPQYGHSIGHAVEHLSWKDQRGPPLLHGEACAIGMAVSAEVSYVMGICDEETVERHYEVFDALGLPSVIPANLPIEEVLAKLTFDKHFVAAKPTMGLLRKMGQMYEENGVHGIKIEPDVLLEAIQRNVNRDSE